MKISEVSQRYAQAIFDLSSKPEEKEKRLENLEHIVQMLKEFPQFMRFFVSPQILLKQKLNVLERITQSLNDPQLLAFISLILQKGRFQDLSEIVKAYRHQLNESLGYLKVRLITAVPLDSSVKAILQEKLEKTYQKKVMITEKIDTHLIGGGVLLIGNQMIDFSIKNKLENLKEDLLSIHV